MAELSFDDGLIGFLAFDDAAIAVDEEEALVFKAGGG